MANQLIKTLADWAKKAVAYQPPGNTGFRLSFTSAAEEAKSQSDTPAAANQRLEGSPDYKPVDAFLPSPPEMDLEKNIAVLGGLFHHPANKDFIIRRFTLGLKQPVKAAAVFLDGMTDKSIQDLAVMAPLMGLQGDRGGESSVKLCQHVQNALLPANELTETVDWDEVVAGITLGMTVILIDKCREIILVETKGWDRRPIGVPRTETVLRGPQEAFNETLKSNTTLIRRRLRTPHLVTELLTVGQISGTACAMMYLEGLANPVLVAEVKKRLRGIKTDYVADSGVLEQFIEDNYWVPFPLILSTERPDRVASMIAEGRVAIVLDGDPFVLVVPTNFFTFLHSPEDTGVRWPFGNFLRLVRTAAAITALFLPGLFVALITFHEEMIPTDLLFTIAGARERVPFPTAVEILLMELAFELIREAGTRVPGVIGQTVGIVGGLILGQAAVIAALVSPIAVIVVAITALGSFGIPSNSMGFSLRTGRFIFIILGATFGFVGIALGLVTIALLMAGLYSYGVPYLAPVAPGAASSSDSLYRATAWDQKLRPSFYEPLSTRRQPKTSRPWRKGGGGK